MWTTLLHLDTGEVKALATLIITLVLAGLIGFRRPKKSKSQQQPPPHFPPQSNLAQFTPERLSRYNGSDPSLPLLLGIKGRVLDVATGYQYYSSGQPYNVFAGKDGSRGLAVMSKRLEDAVCDLTNLTERQTKTLDDWERKLIGKYPQVGTVTHGPHPSHILKAKKPTSFK